MISSTFLKNIAIILMFINHLCNAFMRNFNYDGIWYLIQIILTRGAFLIFAFQLSESIDKTSNIKNYLLKLLSLAFLSEIPFDYALYDNVFYPFAQNVFWTLFLAALSITLIKKYDNILLKISIFLITILLSYLLKADYCCFGILVIMTFYFFKKSKIKYIIVAFLCLSIEFINLPSLIIYNFQTPSLLDTLIIGLKEVCGCFIFPLLLRYNGQKGKGFPSLFYYLFYPLHLILIVILRFILFI